MNKIFIRNDDIRDKLDGSLIDITELCLKKDACIIHAVEPANVKLSVAQWLIEIKKKCPLQVEIIQHGYDHNVRKMHPYGMELGGYRDYNSQYEDIKAGMVLMDQYFENGWSKIMSFPYGTFNRYTFKVLEDLNFKAITSVVDFSPLQKMKDYTGRILRQDLLFGKKISYHDMRRSIFNFYEFDTSINIIKKHKGYAQAEHYTLEEIIQKIKVVSKQTEYIGILLHHRFHSQQIDMLSKMLDFCKTAGFSFCTLNDLINEKNR